MPAFSKDIQETLYSASKSLVIAIVGSSVLFDQNQDKNNLILITSDKAASLGLADYLVHYYHIFII